jgi:hypothetical protein
MRPVEEFLKEYFQARTQHYRKSSASWTNSMTHYFAPGCKPFAPEAAVEQSEAEEIVASRSSEAEAEVITSGIWRVQEHVRRGRYKLAAAGEPWQIVSIEVECGLCAGSGKRKEKDCKICKGNGWILLGGE